MSLLSRPPANEQLESEASRITDPIERLQFLQRQSVAVPVAESIQPVNAVAPERKTGKFLRVLCFTLILAGLLAPGYQASDAADAVNPPAKPGFAASPADVVPNIWIVDKSAEYETYSNGLRIDNRYAVANDQRVFYPVYERGAIDPGQPEWRSEPAGIVYHTTESDQAEFDPSQNGELQRIKIDVLSFIRRNHCYHFFIDRFGQVYRVVREADVANHAGYSVWANGPDVYVNLNSSFLGVVFETQTQRSEDMPSANQAQIHSARVLTQMLRAKYHIPAENCVTHAQVSVNPDNMRIGYHTDWAGNFPFFELGLKDNYTVPPPSISVFGFDYDPTFVHATGSRIWQGLALAEDETQTGAIASGLTVSEYRSVLRKKYKEIIANLKAAADDKENHHAS